jgi:hypothetical protein
MHVCPVLKIMNNSVILIVPLELPFASVIELFLTTLMLYSPIVDECDENDTA